MTNTANPSSGVTCLQEGVDSISSEIRNEDLDENEGIPNNFRSYLPKNVHILLKNPSSMVEMYIIAIEHGDGIPKDKFQLRSHWED